jgi:hypothetical protein
MSRLASYLLLLLVTSYAQADVGGDGSINFPSDLVGMDGWHGVRVIKSEKYGQPQCDASFPNDFGSRKEEIEFLNYFIAHGRQIQDESNCDILSMKYGVLDQLRLLAIQKQQSNAANLLLYYGTPTMPFHLDGEVAETYTESYLLPVLEKFVKLNGLLTNDKTEMLARKICSEVSWRQDVKDAKMLARIRRMVDHLYTIGAKHLAEKIHQTCNIGPRN